MERVDQFGQTLEIGDRVAFITARGAFARGEIRGLEGEGLYCWATIHTDGRRNTSVRTNRMIKEPR